MWKTITFEKKDRIGILKICRPAALNALNAEVLGELAACADAVAADPQVDVLILTGEGERAFVAGADIVLMQSFSAEDGAAWGRLGQKIFTAIENLPQPVIAAINGFALGGGNELALACDIRIASEKARFGQPEVGLGIIAGFGGSQRLPRLVGAAHAAYLLYTGEIIDSRKALEIGLVNMVTPHEEVMATALAVAGKIVAQRPFAVRQSKRSLRRGLECSMLAGQEFEAQALGLCFSTSDQKEAMAAFVNRKK